MKTFIEVTDTDVYGKATTKRLINANWIYDIHPSSDGENCVIRFSPVSIIENRAHGITIAESYVQVREALHCLIQS